MGMIRANMLILVLVAGLLVGCGEGYSRDDWTNFWARQMVEPKNITGKLLIAVHPSGGQMVTDGDIDAHREIERPDGAVIDVWVLRGKGERQGITCVMLHGLMGTKAQWLGMGRLLAEKGFDVVLPDLRAHGRSTGDYVTFGALEQHDIKAVMDALIEDGTVAKRVSAFGVSMGATIAILYAALDKRCESVLTVAPFASAREILRSQLPLTSNERIDEILVAAGRIAHCNLMDTSAVAAAMKLRCPFVLYHGSLDMVVPYEHGRWIYDAAGGPKRFERLHLSTHTTSMVFRNDQYAAAIAELSTKGLPAGTDKVR